MSNPTKKCKTCSNKATKSHWCSECFERVEFIMSEGKGETERSFCLACKQTVTEAEIGKHSCPQMKEKSLKEYRKEYEIEKLWVKCEICSEKTERIAVLDFDFVVPPHSELELRIFQNIVPHCSEKVQGKINSLCQEISSWFKKAEPLMKEQVILVESFIQEKLGKSLLDINPSNRIWLCKFCSQETKKITTSPAEEYYSKNPNLRTSVKETYNKINLLHEICQKDIGKEKHEELYNKLHKELAPKQEKETIAKVKTWLETKNLTPKQDLKLQTNQSKPTNWIPWIVGGLLGGSLMIGLTIWLVLRKKSKKQNAN